MGKRIRNLSFLAAFIAVMTMTSCKNTPKYVSMIPDDAVVVMRYDVKQIAEKSGAEGNDQLKNRLREMLTDTELSAAARDKMAKILDDPAEAGIDLRDPFVAYVSAENNMDGGAVLGTVYDAGKLEELLNTISKEAGTEAVKKEGDMWYYYGKDYILAFNDDVLYAKNIGYVEEKRAVADMAAVLSGEREYAMKDNKFLTQMFDRDGIMQVLVMGDIYNKVPEMAAAAKSMPEGLNMKDAAYLLDLTIDKGEATVNGEILTASGEWDDFIEKGDKLLKPISGDLLEYVSKNGLAFMLNCDGTKILSFLKENGLMAKAGKETTDMAEKMLSSIDGNIVIGVGRLNTTGLGIPEFSLYAKTKDSSISDLFRAFLRKADIGYRDNVTYCLLGAQNEPFKAAQNPFGKDDVKGKLLYYYFNFSMLGDMAGAAKGDEAIIMNAAKDIFDYGEISYNGGGKAQMRITMRDKDKYPIEAVVEYAAKSMN